jgi:hypothetical protein
MRRTLKIFFKTGELWRLRLQGCFWLAIMVVTVSIPFTLLSVLIEGPKMVSVIGAISCVAYMTAILGFLSKVGTSEIWDKDKLSLARQVDNFKQLNFWFAIRAVAKRLKGRLILTM